MPAEKPIEIKEVHERCILVGVDFGSNKWSTSESLDELERLAETDGAECVGRMTQRLDKPSAKTFIGSGKVQELRELAEALNADVVIFDDELTPSQQSNLERALGMRFKVIDRTALILDIFGQHALTHEGKLQVQMAQLQYLYPRLRGMWAHLAKDKTRGGIGSRFGQGESQLEVDRRLIRNRMATLRRELAKVASDRSVQRHQRTDSAVFHVSLAGYTNAGKSTLLNQLADADVLTKDELFATLDPTTRSIVIPGGRRVVMTDTVGFIQKLPTTLIESFKSTLSEITDADLVIKVADASDAHVLQQLEAVDEILEEIGASDVAQLVVFNKCDRLEESEISALESRYPNALTLCALTGAGTDKLIKAIGDIASSRDRTMQVLIPFSRGDLVKACHEIGTIISEHYTEAGTLITVIAPPSLRSCLEAFSTAPHENDNEDLSSSTSLLTSTSNE